MFAGIASLVLAWLQPEPAPWPFGWCWLTILGTFLVFFAFGAVFGAFVGWLWVVVAVGREQQRRTQAAAPQADC